MLAGCTSTPVKTAAAHKALPSATPSPSRRPAPARRYFWPLTGLPAASASTTPALSIKIDNAPAARPQSGLDRADIVFECLVEGGLSRFLAVYQSHAAPLIGPIRSARPVDGALLRALHGGIFAYSGAANGEIAPAKAYSTSYLLSNDYDSIPFHRIQSRSAPENVYASTGSLRAEAGRHSGRLQTPPSLFTYGPASAGARPATGVTLTIGGQSTAVWKRKGAEYLRWEDGTPHLLDSGVQVQARNVVLIHVQVTGSGITDAAGNEDPFVLAYGAGAIEVLRDGVVERGHWSRPTVAAPFRFTSDHGGALTLTPGQTWVELIPTSGAATID
jgi:Protein of unknown function (DUF3048) N-terminal domain/Protein of unknown function (DUF3048) C-terminal domain